MPPVVHQCCKYDGGALWMQGDSKVQWTQSMNDYTTWDKSSVGTLPNVGSWVARRLMGKRGWLWFRMCVLPSSPYLPTAPPPAFGIDQLDQTQLAGFQALCQEVFTKTGIEVESVEDLFNLQLFWCCAVV